MKGEANIRHIGSIKSMQHCITRPGQNLTTAKLHQSAVDRQRLLKEREIMLARLDEIERKLKYANEQMIQSFVQVKGYLPRGRRKGNSGKEESAKGSSRRTSSMELEF